MSEIGPSSASVPGDRGGLALASLASLAKEHEIAFVDALVEEAENRWTNGSSARLEEIGAELPVAAQLPAARRALLMCEVSRRTREPREAVRQELAQRFPDHREDVDAVVEMAWLMLSAEAQEPVADQAMLCAGARFANFRLCERLGSGSFGEVWRAWDILLERYIALKILHPAPHGDDGAFVAEAQAAASVEHENLVRVHGAGTLYQNGPRYIDSQLVGDPAPTPTDARAVHVGRSLDRVFARTRPDARRAAAIMLAVSRGVAAAHARGVLHRDIKPANILLTPSGKPMVADFGLSSVGATHAPVADDPETHAGGRIVGTPAYMSPEQAQGQRFTPQSDVYGLGATLRFLLTASAPYEPKSAHPRGSRWDVIRQVRAGSAARLAGSPGLPPDLCAICDKAMAVSPGERYLTADKLAEDLDAFLTHHPVSAASNSAIRHGALWYRRHIGVATVGLVAAAAITLSTAVFVRSLKDQRDRAVSAEREAGRQRDRAIQAQQDATRQRDAAETSRQIAEAINQFLADCVRVAESESPRDATTMKEVVSLIERRATGTLKPNPLVQAGVMQAIAGMRDADRYVSAAAGLLGRALEINTRILGPEAPQTLRTRQLYQSMRARLGGVKREDCERELREVLEIQTRLFGAESQDTLATTVSLAAMLDRERAPEAEELLRRALRGYDAQNNPLSVARMQALRQLSVVCSRQSKFEAAVEINALLVSLLREGMGERDPETISRRLVLASALRSAGRSEEAAAEYLSAARHIEWVRGEPDIDAATAFDTAGELWLFSLGQPERAIDAVEPVIWCAPPDPAWREARVRAHAVRAQALLDMGMPAPALRDLKQARTIGAFEPFRTNGLERRVLTLLDRAQRKVPREEVTLPGPADPAGR